MCSLGKLIKDKVTHELVEGYRGWEIKIKDNDGLLYPLYKKRYSPFNKEGVSQANVTNPLIKTEEGFYAYTNYYNYNYNYYNNYNYNNYYYNYYVAGKIILTGDIAHHKLGYRATEAQPSLLVRLTPKEGLTKKFQTFLNHFNSLVETTAKNYSIKVVDHIDFK